jgi:hypothetical protein
VAMVYYEISQEFKEGRFTLPMEEEVKLATIILYLQRGPFRKEHYTKHWLEQFRSINAEVSDKIEQSYTEYYPSIGIIPGALHI